MANNQSIQILRGNNVTIANAAKNNVELLDDQLLYNTDTNQLSIGGANKSLNKQPLNYREENQNLKFPIKEVLNYYD